MDFTLPPLRQESFTRWYNKKLPRDDDKDERVVYPGVKLQCSTRSRDLRSQVNAENVFITHIKDTNTYNHKVLGSNNIFIQLPKRLYSHCFRNINIHSIPNNNRIRVRLTETTTVVLPFIPDDFVAQKRSKRSGGSRAIRARKQDKKQKTEHVPDNALYTGWVSHVMAPATELGAENAIDSFTLFAYIRSVIENYETSIETSVPNPFANTKTIDEIHEDASKQQILTHVIQFVHQYAKHFL